MIPEEKVESYKMAKGKVLGRVQEVLTSIFGVLTMALLQTDPEVLKPHPLPLSVPLRWIFGEQNACLSDIGNNYRGSW